MQYAEDIPWNNLPLTIQDAVKVTENLGLQYLWVDSLCIVQDDEADVNVEIAKVPQVYGSSICTIVACRAETATHGFLQDVVFHAITDVAAKVKVKCPVTQVTIPAIAARLSEEYYQQPTESRGWCFQELILSNRVLEFKTTGIQCT